jgi:hypothetical protein
MRNGSPRAHWAVPIASVGVGLASEERRLHQMLHAAIFAEGLLARWVEAGEKRRPFGRVLTVVAVLVLVVIFRRHD